jgi:uncharacterized protein YkwD
MMENHSHKKLLFSFLIVGLLAALLLVVFDDTGRLVAVKRFLGIENFGVIETIKKEVSNPGALIARIESSRAFLTKEGVFMETNEERTEMGLIAFQGDILLDDIAKERLDDMFERQYFEHISPEGQSASTVAVEVGYEYISIGENIALGNFEDDMVLVQAWMDSPGHRANILNSKFTHLGVAVGRATFQGKDTWMGVQIFGRPLSLCGEVDADLKLRVDRLINEIDTLRVRIEAVEKEIEELSQNRRENREEYNAKVEEYNNLAQEINSRNATAKTLIAEYNADVRRFNSCLENA